MHMLERFILKETISDIYLNHFIETTLWTLLGDMIVNLLDERCQTWHCHFLEIEKPTKTNYAYKMNATSSSDNGK